MRAAKADPAAQADHVGFRIAPERVEDEPEVLAVQLVVVVHEGEEPAPRPFHEAVALGADRHRAVVELAEDLDAIREAVACDLRLEGGHHPREEFAAGLQGRNQDAQVWL